MPKVKKKVGHRHIKKIVPMKFRIGNRKNGRSALFMSDDELWDVIEKSSRPRDKQNARHVLNERYTHLRNAA